MSMRVEIEREEDGRSIAEIPAIPGAFVTLLRRRRLSSR
jgi:hypothetical protein